MRPAALLPALLLPACTSPNYHGEDAANPRPDLLEPQNRIVLLAGQRSLDDDFDPAQDQLAFGLEVNVEPPDLPVGIELGVGFSDESASSGGISTEVTTYDLTAGVRKTFRLANGRIRPYVGLGGSFIHVDAQSGSSVDDGDTGFGIYGRAGVWFMFTDRVGVGADFRRLMAADVTLDGNDLSADYDQLSIGFGFGF
jgi:hypothetical protein